MPEKNPEQNGVPQPKDPDTRSQPKVPVPAESPATTAPAKASSSPAQVLKSGKKENSNERTADKPHRYTIILGIVTAGVAAVLTLVGHVLTYRGQQLTQNNQEISQQPYVVVTAGKFDLLPMVAGPVPQPVAPEEIISTEPAGPFLGTDISVTIANNGNTAAEFVSFKASFDPLPDGWSLRKRLMIPPERPSYLGPKSQLLWHYHQPFNLTPQAWALFRKSFNEGGILKFLRFTGELVYQDEFKTEHTTRWCWETAADHTNDGRVQPCPFQ
jgi:hypothetical protein